MYLGAQSTLGDTGSLMLLTDFHVPHESLMVPGALLVEGGKCLSSLFAVKSVASAGE